MISKNICLVSYESPPMIGGEGVYSYTLASALSALGHNVTLITSAVKDDKKNIGDYFKNKFDVIRVPASKIFRLYAFDKKAKEKIRGLYQAGDIDILHYTNDVMYLSISKKDANVPLIVTVHHPWAAERKFFRTRTNFLGFLRYAYSKKIYYLEWLEKRICKNSDKIIAVSSYTANSIINEYQIPSERVTVIPNAVDVQRFNPNVNGHEIREKLGLLSEPIVLYVGRLDYHKGVNYLIEAFAKVVKEFPNTKLVIVGDGPTRKNIEYLVDIHKLTRSAIFAGRVTDEVLPKYYAASDLVVLPSLMEGFGIVLLEAMASGKPCVATKVGGTEDAVIDNENGFLVPPADSDALYQAVRSLLLDKNLSKKFGVASRHRVLENFTPDRIARQVVNVYNQI